jgi:hypothetical protein
MTAGREAAPFDNRDLMGHVGVLRIMRDPVHAGLRDDLTGLELLRHHACSVEFAYPKKRPAVLPRSGCRLTDDAGRVFMGDRTMTEHRRRAWLASQIPERCACSTSRRTSASSCPARAAGSSSTRPGCCSGGTVLQRRHRIPSDTLIFDLQFRLRCGQCNRQSGFRIAVADQRGRGDRAAARPERVIVPADKDSNPIAGTNGPMRPCLY